MPKPYHRLGSTMPLLDLCLGPFSIRYLKSTLRWLVRAPHYVILCVPDNCDDETVVSKTGTEDNVEIDLL